MYLLQFLARSSSHTADAVNLEYRLACSGQLFNRRVLTAGDYQKSDASRVLLRAPLELFVVSQPFDSYPQELCARLTLDYITEQAEKASGSASVTLLPDQDVMEDFCSILSLLSRRLISPIGETRVQHNSSISPSLDALGSYASDFPVPILHLPQAAVWKPRPATVLTSVEGQRLINNSPPPVGVDPSALSEFLLRLPKISRADQIVYASRLYRAALEMIETRPDIAYQLLISTVESLADVAFSDYEPEESEKVATKSAVQRCARDLGLDQDKAKQLALAACETERWLKKKFKKFVLDFASLDELGVKDRVFLVPENFCPEKENIPKTLGRIYGARSVNLHCASPFPRSVGIGTSPWINVRLLPAEWFQPPEIPPVPWFERVVWLAANRFLIEQSSIKSAPFMSA